MHVNHIATLAHAPWLLVACHGVHHRHARPAASFALARRCVTGSQLLTGNPQYVWITLVAAICTASAWHWSIHRRISSIAALGARRGALGCWLIGAIQLLPSI